MVWCAPTTAGASVYWCVLVADGDAGARPGADVGLQCGDRANNTKHQSVRLLPRTNDTGKTHTFSVEIWWASRLFR